MIGFFKTLAEIFMAIKGLIDVISKAQSNAEKARAAKDIKEALHNLDNAKLNDVFNRLR